MNKLADEKSPYLLQHAHNPVQWLPWGEAAFQQARDENNPIFLSIGYSTCHWCHVMERESFENEATAQLMNEHFVNIKVDREERPDVDRLYMTFVQATTGSGGWPLSVFLTPDLKPFFGGTYFPPTDAYGRIGFPELLLRLASAWKDDREKVLESSQSVIEGLERYASLESKNAPRETDWNAIAQSCFRHFQTSFDAQYGGFGEAPKFPRPVAHDFLHRHALVVPEGQNEGTLALQMSSKTLRGMGDGGMNDQLGGGFHRYSVDSQWIVSHFEKMLYDQAQLVVSYLEMFQLTRHPYFADSARSTLDYVLRDMTHAQGGFFAGEDADSFVSEGDAHKEEGAFYVWTKAEIQEILGKDREGIFCEYYGVEADGNAPQEGDPHGEFKGKNILVRAKQLPEIAPGYLLSDEEAEGVLRECRELLFQVRENRPRPHRDEKIIVAWNGLMISAFARAAGVLGEAKYLEAATRAASFIQAELWDESTQALRRHFKDGAADVPGFAEDYAFLVRGLLDLYEVGFDLQHLQFAEKLNDLLLANFWDEDTGGVFSSAPDENILLRFKEDYDGAEPSPNSIAADNCVRLWHLLDRQDLSGKAHLIFEAFAGRLRDIAPAMPFMLAARMNFDSPPTHIVIAGGKTSEQTQALLRVVNEGFAPLKSVLLLDESSREYFTSRLPFTAEMKMVEGKATAYLCREFACRQPVTTPGELRELLEN